MAPEEPLRFLLDQGFPKPRWDVHQLDRTVEYVHLSDWAPELARSSTPDWLVQLAAEAAGLTGIVTGDYHSARQVEEVIALDRTRLSVVTWSRDLGNPVVQWGSLLAYMPRIKRVIGERGPSIVTLPAPVVPRDVERTAGVGSRFARQQGVSRADLDRTRREMIDELVERGRGDLAEVLRRRPNRPPRATRG